MKKPYIIILLSFVFTTSVFSQQKNSEKEFYKEIVKMDSIFFAAYNNCDIEKQASIYADSIEFYHDKGGFINF